MSNYTKITDFAAKDALSPGNPSKIIKGTEHAAELNAIATAIASKLDVADGTSTGTMTVTSANVLGQVTAAGLVTGARFLSTSPIAFHAWNDGTLGIQSSGTIPVTNVTRFNLGSAFSTATYKFTVPVTGLYWLAGYCYVSDNLSAGNSAMLSVFVEGVGVAAYGDLTRGPTGSFGYASSGVQGVFYLTAGQVVYLRNEGEIWTSNLQPLRQRFMGALLAAL